jgi:hypothetical protein
VENAGDAVTEAIVIIRLVHKPTPQDESRQHYKGGRQPSSETAESPSVPGECFWARRVIFPQVEEDSSGDAKRCREIAEGIQASQQTKPPTRHAVSGGGKDINIKERPKHAKDILSAWSSRRRKKNNL